MASILRWDRDPEPAWIAALHQLSPPREHLSHLTIKWVPFAERRWAARWVIFECIPIAYASPVLEGITEEMVLHDPLMRWAWRYALERDAFPVPFWVCQGNPMGHPYRYNVIEKAQASVGLLPEKPPVIGELAYAEPTDLTWEAIRRRSNITRKLKDAFAERDRLKAEAERQARKTLLDDAEANLTDAMREAQDVVLDTARTVERGARDKANVTDDHMAEYIETGIVPALG